MCHYNSPSYKYSMRLLANHKSIFLKCDFLIGKKITNTLTTP